jgi:hypothetical protein
MAFKKQNAVQTATSIHRVDFESFFYIYILVILIDDADWNKYLLVKTIFYSTTDQAMALDCISIHIIVVDL